MSSYDSLSRCSVTPGPRAFHLHRISTSMVSNIQSVAEMIALNGPFSRFPSVNSILSIFFTGYSLSGNRSFSFIQTSSCSLTSSQGKPNNVYSFGNLEILSKTSLVKTFALDSMLSRQISPRYFPETSGKDCTH